ncbi:hypothetical protein [Haloimpatiens lingqiaonensis]|uniref:hypothetical protein n=1 Tax=Haloimpatiens lingqiaonensis TaxID=1380675 RepID=UPI0010FD6B50|nr:hypothetical protein [Haloimpatiens lingqiaonensis]
MRKRFLIIIGILCFLCTAVAGCKSKELNTQEQKKKMDTNAASNLVDRYMRGLIMKDYDGVKKMYTEDMIKEQGNYKKSDIIVRGYRVEDVAEMEKNSVFKVKAVSTREKSAYTSLDEYRISVIKEKDGYKIAEVNITPQKEIFSDGYEVRIRDKSNVETNLVIDMENLPKSAFPKEDKLSMYKQEVPSKSFNDTSISFDGTKVLVSTKDKDAYAASILIDETLAVQGKNGDKEGEEAEKQAGDNKNKGIKEKPIGKEIINLDIIKDAAVDYMVFSQDEKFITIQYSKSDGTKCIRIYESDSGKMIPVKFEDSFPIDKVSIEFSYFDKENAIFRILPKDNLEEKYKDLMGNWKLNLKDFKIHRI